MHAVPANLDLGRLIGQDLTQICIGKFCMLIYLARPIAGFPATPKDRIDCEGTVMADFGGSTTLIFDTHPSLLVGGTPEEAIAWRDASISPSCALAHRAGEHTLSTIGIVPRLTILLISNLKR